jgi:hypothetical protein
MRTRQLPCGTRNTSTIVPSWPTSSGSRGRLPAVCGSDPHRRDLAVVAAVLLRPWVPPFVLPNTMSAGDAASQRARPCSRAVGAPLVRSSKRDAGRRGDTRYKQTRTVEEVLRICIYLLYYKVYADQYHQAEVSSLFCYIMYTRVYIHRYAKEAQMKITRRSDAGSGVTCVSACCCNITTPRLSVRCRRTPIVDPLPGMAARSG